MDRSTPPPYATPNGANAPSPARRRLLHGGIASAPVLLTLVSRPVLGAVQCSATSAFASIGGSVTRTLATCGGKSPATWVSLSTWPTPYYPTGQNATAYHCTTTGLMGTTFSSNTMRHVMNLSDDGATRTLGRYIAAALLNAKSGLTPVLTETAVRQIWNDYTLYGRFEPTAGVSWGAAEIITYIKSTIG